MYVYLFKYVYIYIYGYIYIYRNIMHNARCIHALGQPTSSRCTSQELALFSGLGPGFDCGLAGAGSHQLVPPADVCWCVTTVSYACNMYIICIYIYIRIYIYVYIYALCICTDYVRCIYVYVYIYIYMYICICMYIIFHV